jgi:hypothetical protein
LLENHGKLCNDISELMEPTGNVFRDELWLIMSLPHFYGIIILHIKFSSQSWFIYVLYPLFMIISSLPNGDVKYDYVFLYMLINQANID